MANDTPLRDPAHQLFIQEALELLLQIEKTLQEVLQIPSQSAIGFLLEMTLTLQDGAQSLGLNQLSDTSQTFAGLIFRFQQDPLSTTPDDAGTLKQAYKEMQSSLATYIPGTSEVTSTPTEFVAVEENNSHKLGDSLAAEVAGSVAAAGNDVTSLILTTDVAELLDNLNQVLINPQVYDLADELKTLTESLLGWGEVLELSEFITIAQSTLEMLASNPHAAMSIGQLSLAGFRAAYKTALQGYPASGTDLPEGHPTLVNENATVAEIPTAESLSASNEVTLAATELFMWQQEKLLFTISSAAVDEILIPRAEQLMGNEQQRCLSWQQQFIPIYPVQHLLNHGKTNWPRLSVGPAPQANPLRVFGSSPLVIVQQGGQTLALEVQIERLVTEKELKLTLFADRQHCPYFCGDMVLETGRYGVIDVERLLHHVLELSPLPMSKASASQPATPSTSPRPQKTELEPPAKKTRLQSTILVVDDSRMVRMMVGMSLQTAGYEVIEAADGKLAIDQLQATPIDLIVCDVEMPNMNGFEFLEYRCRQPNMTNIPVVMLSTCNSDQHRYLATTLGASAYLNKPYDEANLLATLQALIS